MEAFKGEPRDGKDATFQGARSPQTVAPGDHNGWIRRSVCKSLDHGPELAKCAMEYT
jgi:hypothetical protein